MRTLNGMDAAFLHAETTTMHLHVVGVLVLDPSTASGGWRPELIEAVLASRLHLFPPFRWRLITVPGAIDRPQWIEDPDFDLPRHIHRVTLTPPGGHEQLARFVGECASRPLDRNRPLWELWVVEDPGDGTVALVTKLHHAIMDGGGGISLMASLLDLGPEAQPAAGGPETWWWPDRRPSTVALLTGALGSSAVRMADAPLNLVRAGRSFGGLLRTRWAQPASLKPPRFGPRIPSGGALTAARSVALARCSFDDVRLAKGAFETTVNDVVLAATSSAMRAYLQKLDALPRGPLKAAVPVSVRSDGPSFGNHTSVMMVALPTHVEDPVERLRCIHDQAVAAKAAHSAMGTELVEHTLAIVPLPLINGLTGALSGLRLARVIPPVINIVVSNVAGPRTPLYCAGARVVAVYPMGPLIEGAGLNLTVLSQDNDLDVGVMACPDLMGEPDVIASGFADGLSELVAAIPDSRHAPARPAAGVATDRG